MRDTVNVVREGVPAVGLCHEPFKALAQLAVKQIGMADAPILAYPRDLVNEETTEMLEHKSQAVLALAVPIILAVGK